MTEPSPESNIGATLPPFRIEVAAPKKHRLLKAALGITALVAMVASGLGIAEKYGPGDIFPDLGLGEIHVPVVDSPPAKVEASIAKDTYSSEQFDASIKGRIDVGVGVVSEKTDGTAKGKVDRMFFGDFLAAGNTKTATVNAVVHRVDGKVVDVTLNAPGLSNIQPRIDFTDPRNCADIKSKDTIDKVNKKEQEYQSKVDQGKKPSCALAVEFGNINPFVPAVGRTKELLKVIQPTYAAAQIVIGAAGSITKAANEFNVSYAADLKTELQNQYPGAPVTVTIDNQMTTDQQIESTIKELEKNNFVVTRVTDKANPLVVAQLKILSPDGSTITANLDTPDIKKEPIKVTSFTKSDSKTPAMASGRG